MLKASPLRGEAAISSMRRSSSAVGAVSCVAPSADVPGTWVVEGQCCLAWVRRMSMGPGRARARGAGAGGVELCRPDVGREREDGSWQGECGFAWGVVDGC
jgi:hypothetical protein